MTQTYTQSNNTDPTKAVFGEQSSAVSALQTQLNTQNAGVAGYTPLKVDGMYGPLTQAATQFKAPVAPVNPTPTPDPLGGVRRYTGTATDPAKNPGDDYYNNLNTTPVDETKIKNDIMTQYQPQIDAMNNVYNGLIADEKVAGEGRAGSTRATDARSGLLGSDFGNTDKINTDTFNESKVKALKDEQALKISDIMNKIYDRDYQAIKDAKDLVFKNQEEKLAYNQKKQDAARADIKSLAGSGVDLNSLTQDEYNKLIEQTGYTDQELKAAFVLNKPQDTVLDHQVLGNKYFQVTKDPLTGKIKSDTITLPFNVPEGYSAQKMTDGSLVFVPSKIDPSKPIESQVIMYGTKGEFAKPTTTTPKGTMVSGKVTITPDKLTAYSNELEKARTIPDASNPSKKYVDPATYNLAQQAWTDAGGLAKDFQSKYPPTKYLKPVIKTGTRSHN